jgi:hypothetical protein
MKLGRILLDNRVPYDSFYSLDKNDNLQHLSKRTADVTLVMIRQWKKVFKWGMFAVKSTKPALKYGMTTRNK